MKTPELLHIIHSERHKILANEEVRKRIQVGPLTDERVWNLIRDATGDIEQADKAMSQFILEDTRAKK